MSGKASIEGPFLGGQHVANHTLARKRTGDLDAIVDGIVEDRGTADALKSELHRRFRIEERQTRFEFDESEDLWDNVPV